MARQADYCGSNADPLNYRIEHARTRPSVVLPREGFRQLPGTMHKGGIRRSRKGKERLQGSLYLGWRSQPLFPAHSWQDCPKEPPHTGHRVHGGPRREMSGGDADELGELPC
jgi:hypothetical protein